MKGPIVAPYTRGPHGRAMQQLGDQVSLLAGRLPPLFTDLGEPPQTGRDLSYFRRIDTTDFESHYAAGCIGAEDMTATSFSVDTLYAVPEVFAHGYRVAELSARCTAASAGAVFRLGIYTSTDDLAGNPYPDRLLVDTGEMDGSADAVLDEDVANVSLEPGRLYWFVYLAGTAAPSLRALQNAQVWSFMGVEAALGTAPQWGYTVAFTYAALPTFFPPAATAAASSTVPAVFMRLDRSLYERERIVPFWTPDDDGYALRRATLLWPSALSPSPYPSSVVVEPGFLSEGRFSALATFDSRTRGVDASGRSVMLDTETALRDDFLLAVRVVSAGWPPLSLADASVQWDIARVGAA